VTAATMAAFAGCELEALPLVFARLRGASTAEDARAAGQVLARWTDLPLAAAVPPALRTLIAERGVSDLSRLVAAAVLEAYGDAMTDAELVQHLDDPAALERNLLDRALSALRHPAGSIRLAERLQAMPQETVLALADGLADPMRHGSGAASLLLALAHSRAFDTAIAGIGALDGYTAIPASILDGLETVAMRHPEPGVRRQAEATLGRLPGLPPLTTAGSPEAGLRALAGGQLADQQGHSGVALMAWPAAAEVDAMASGAMEAVSKPGLEEHDRKHDVLSIRLRAGEFAEYALAPDLAGPVLDQLVEAFSARGAPLVGVDPEALRRRLEEASGITLASGGASGTAWAAWRAPFATVGPSPQADDSLSR